MKKNLFRLTVLCIAFCFNSTTTKAQKKKWYTPSKIGFSYGYGNQGKPFLNDKDYSYNTNLFKIQFYYPLKSGKINFDLVFEPTLGFAEHQLLNEHFVRPIELDYIALREEFTKKKQLNEYILNTNLIVGYKLYRSNIIYALIGFGPVYISKRTERLAKGFAFQETVGLGISSKIYKKLYVDIKGYYRHLSNAELNQPNSGINVAILEIGFKVGL